MIIEGPTTKCYHSPNNIHEHQGACMGVPIHILISENLKLIW